MTHIIIDSSDYDLAIAKVNLKIAKLNLAIFELQIVRDEHKEKMDMILGILKVRAKFYPKNSGKTTDPLQKYFDGKIKYRQIKIKGLDKQILEEQNSIIKYNLSANVIIPK